MRALPAILVTAFLCSTNIAAAVEPYSNWYFSMSALSKLSLDDGDIAIETPPSGVGGALGFPLLDTTGIALTPGSTTNTDASYDEDSNAVRFAFGKNFDQRYRLEFEYSESVNDINEFGGMNAAGELRIETYAANAWYDFFAGSSLQPYLGVGIGKSTITLGDIYDDVTSYQAGVGIAWKPIPVLTLDLGYRLFESGEAELEYDNGVLKSEFSGNAVALNIRFNFFASRSSRPYDRLPSSSAAGDPSCANADCSDQDQDGLTDDKDECPNTEPGSPIDVRGCADHDQDNVADIRDMCPNTPIGSPVMTNGCAAKQSTILQGVNFEYASANLTFTAKKILQRMANVMKDSPDFALNIVGHTDNMGSEDFNLQLSQSRADSVAAYLRSLGVDSKRLQAVGRGESMPIADNASPEGRATNRRVEILVKDYDQR